MTTVKGGSDTDHFVFQPQGHIAYGLTITENMKELSASSWADAPALAVKPILEVSNAYKVLWPLATSDLSNDPELVQNPGYEMN